MPKIEDITPEDSVVPVYSVIYSEDEEQYVELTENELSPDEKFAKDLELKKSALDKLAKLGLTEEEAKAIAGV